MSVDWREIPGRYIRDPRLGHRLGRNYPAGELSDPIWDLYWLGTDQYGLVYNQESNRDHLLNDSKFFRAFLFGGSTMMGLGVKNNNQTISSNLETSLQKKIPHARTANCAVGAYTSWQEMTYLSLEIIHYKPDVVIIMDGWNDFLHSSWGNKDYKGKWIPNTQRSLDDIVNYIKQATGELTFIEYLRKRFERLEIVREFRKKSAYAIQAGAWTDPDYRLWSLKPESIDYYINNHINMIGMCHAHGIKVISLLQPQIMWGSRKLTEVESAFIQKVTPRMPPMPELAPKWFALAQAAFNKSRSKLHDGKNIWIEDASDWLNQPSETLYHDYNHYNVLGQKILGEKIADIILTMLN
jgi:GDSL-like Lipase/Acylhydrolase family